MKRPVRNVNMNRTFEKHIISIPLFNLCILSPLDDLSDPNQDVTGMIDTCDVSTFLIRVFSYYTKHDYIYWSICIIIMHHMIKPSSYHRYMYQTPSTTPELSQYFRVNE